MKAQLGGRGGRLWLRRPGCACKMDRAGKLVPCFAHFGAGLGQSKAYLTRAWREYDAGRKGISSQEGLDG